ncbi:MULTISPECIES: hypothetical protein [Methylobacterium]|uniref:Uncharacterized protein n=1 Tax=Methylobacterium ajmalii TaxID=2738439 RepID=A0ABU9ZRD9_9HYPH|nr:hypothetical protein [Methylobacterium aquaticum]
MFSATDTLAMQRAQYRHDKLNHCDIANLHKGERLKHYGLHFCKYVGRFARGRVEAKPVERTVVDAMLVCLSAANTLTQKLSDVELVSHKWKCDPASLLSFADAAGRFADASEKFDHLEDCVQMAREANGHIYQWLIAYATLHNIDLSKGLEKRRLELKERAFYASE